MALVFWVHFMLLYFLLRMHVCFVVFPLVFQYLARRLAGKNVPEMTCFVSGGTSNLNSINLEVLYGILLLM